MIKPRLVGVPRVPRRWYSDQKVSSSLNQMLDSSAKQATEKTNSDFHVHRPVNEGRLGGTQKERQIFTALIDALFEDSSKTKTPIQTLFQKSMKGDNSDLAIMPQDVRRMPLSASLIREDHKTDTSNDEIRRHIKPVLDHMSQLETDQQLLQYYSDKIVNRTLKTELDEPNVDAPPITDRTVSIYLERVLHLLSESFQSPMAAICAFELSKRASLSYFTAACTAPIYNKMILIKWKYFRDFYAIDSLVSEMTVNGIHGDEETVSALGVVNSDFVKLEYQGSRWSKEDTERKNKLNRFRLDLLRNLSRENYKLALAS